MVKSDVLALNVTMTTVIGGSQSLGDVINGGYFDRGVNLRVTSLEVSQVLGLLSQQQ